MTARSSSSGFTAWYAINRIPLSATLRQRRQAHGFCKNSWAMSIYDKYMWAFNMPLRVTLAPRPTQQRPRGCGISSLHNNETGMTAVFPWPCVQVARSSHASIFRSRGPTCTSAWRLGCRAPVVTTPYDCFFLSLSAVLNPHQILSHFSNSPSPTSEHHWLSEASTRALPII